MTTNRNLWAGLLLLILTGTWGAAAWADKNDWGKGVREQAPQSLKGMVLDRRYDHNHYYPSPGHSVKTLPPGHRIVPYRDRRFYFHGGVWYRPSGPGFVVIRPPIGVRVPILPPYYTTIWVAGVPYYYADGVYYAWRPAERTYVVSEPPPESIVATTPSEPEQLFIYPKQGQSEAQQSTDRYECHRWARDQSNFDPTVPPGETSEVELAKHRADYRRAITACLEARGYSVK